MLDKHFQHRKLPVTLFKIVSFTPSASQNSIQSTLPDTYKFFTIGEIDGVELSGHLYNPFPPGMNPHYESSCLHSKAWLLEQALFSESDKGFQKFLKGDFARLAAYCYRQESEENLHLVTDFIAWLFCHDDFRDNKDIAIGKNPNQIKAMNNFLHDVLKFGALLLDNEKIAQHYPSEDINTIRLERETVIQEYPLISNLGKSLLDIRERLIIQSGHEDISHFVKSMSQYFEANIWEAENKASNIIPTFLEYQHWRQLSSAVFPAYEIGYLLRGLFIPQNIREKTACVTASSCNAIYFVNDLFSLKKEIQDKVSENLVIVKKSETSLTLDTAFDISIRVANKETLGYQRFRAKMETDPELQNFVSICELQDAWIDGNFRWSQECKRYK